MRADGRCGRKYTPDITYANLLYFDQSNQTKYRWKRHVLVRHTTHAHPGVFLSFILLDRIYTCNKFRPLTERVRLVVVWMVGLRCLLERSATTGINAQ
jgi:hypothetical protein